MPREGFVQRIFALWNGAGLGLAEDSDFQVEHRDGGPDRHYVAITDDADMALHVVAGWVDRVDGWDRPLRWERLELS